MLLAGCRSPDAITTTMGVSSDYGMAPLTEPGTFASVSATWFLSPSQVKIVNWPESRPK